MMAARLIAPAEPFTDDTAGFGYFASDSHYQHLTAVIAQAIAETRGFVLVTGEPAPDGSLVERYLAGGKAGEWRVSLVRCRPGMAFGELMEAFGRQLWMSDEGEGGLWPVLSQLMQDARKGILRILVLQDADALDDQSVDELYRFTRLDEPHVLPVVLLASPAFAARIDATLPFLKSVLALHLPVQLLAPDEGEGFIRYQLRSAGRPEDAFAPETIAAIVEAAEGDPAVINRLARQASDRPLMNPPAAEAIPVEVDVVAAPAGAEVIDVPVQESTAPAAPSAPAPAIAPGESAAPAAPARAAPRWQARFPAFGAAWAGYLVLVVASAAALAYALASGRDRAPTPQAVAGSPELARAEAAIAVPRPPAVPSPRATEARSPALPDVPDTVPAPPAAPSESTARELAAVEPSAPAAVPEPAAEPKPEAAAASPAPPPALAMVEPEPVPVTARPAQSPPSRDVTMLVQRGGELLAAGDIVSARRFFERAAESGDPTAALGVGKSDDPLFLERVRTRGIVGDPTKAAAWYRRAAAAGSAEAAALLTRLLVKYPR